MISHRYRSWGKSRDSHLRRAEILAASFFGAVALGVITDVPPFEMPILGPVSKHMAIHLFLMNALAPLLAFAACRACEWASSGRALLTAAIMQVVLLWAAHIPAVVEGSHDAAINLASNAILFVTSLWFWLAVLSQRGSHRWRSIAALLLTGKLFCLLGALLVFSPRLLYLHSDARDLPTSIAASGLMDQHQAGLLMIVVCPLTYVGAAVIIAALWLEELSAQNRQPGGSIHPAVAN